MLPLAERLRPKNINQIIGQQHLLAEGKSLRNQIEKRKITFFDFLGTTRSWQNNFSQNHCHSKPICHSSKLVLLLLA
jgi:hypothetical protein